MEICGFHNCLSCTLVHCWTGQIAREQGEEAYNKHLDMLQEAQEIMEKEALEELPY